MLPGSGFQLMYATPSRRIGPPLAVPSGLVAIRCSFQFSIHSPPLRSVWMGHTQWHDVVSQQNSLDVPHPSTLFFLQQKTINLLTGDTSPTYTLHAASADRNKILKKKSAHPILSKQWQSNTFVLVAIKFDDCLLCSNVSRVIKPRGSRRFR